MARLKDVAKMANVSICTASKIINQARGWDLYSEDCVKRVRAASKALAYKPNYHAIALKAGRSKAIGMVMITPKETDTYNPFLTGVLLAVDISAIRTGFHFVVIGDGSQSNALDNALLYLKEGRVDGLVIQGSTLIPEKMKALEDAQSPIVLINFDAKTTLPRVGIDHAIGIQKAVRRLAELKHRRLLYVGPAPQSDSLANTFANKARRDAFAETCEELGLEARFALAQEKNIFGSEIRNIQSAHDLCLANREVFDSCTGVVCFNELTALGVYAAAQETGRRVPQDLSIIGFDNIYAPMAWPPMTVVSHMLNEIGETAVRRVIEMTKDVESWDKLRGNVDMIEPVLVERGSAGPAPQA
jgi:LacI family transcriptional regulator